MRSIMSILKSCGAAAWQQQGSGQQPARDKHKKAVFANF